MTISVAIVDDQVLFCTGMQMLIESQDDLVFVGSAHEGRAAETLARESRPDVILMDIRMPERDGIAATAAILAEARQDSSVSPPRIIVLTTFQHDSAVVRAIAAGASGFLMKDSTPEFVLAAIRTVHEGHSVIAPSDTAQLLQHYSPRVADELSNRPVSEAIEVLSAREKEVFLLVAKGLSNADIAESAFIAETTVKSHVGSILGKLDLASRVQIVAYAYENRLMR